MKSRNVIKKEVLYKQLNIKYYEIQKEDKHLLQIKAKNLDVVRITKLLSKHHGKKFVSNHTISLYGKVSDELFEELLNNIEIISAQNFPSDVKWLQKLEDVKAKDIVNESLPNNTLFDNDLLFPIAKRGEVYWCWVDFVDFNGPNQWREGKLRPVIVVQNEEINPKSIDTIVLPCTSQIQNWGISTLKVEFSEKSMLDFNPNNFGKTLTGLVEVEQIQCINKKRLRKYIGKMTPEFMMEIQKIIDSTLGLKRDN